MNFKDRYSSAEILLGCLKFGDRLILQSIEDTHKRIEQYPYPESLSQLIEEALEDVEFQQSLYEKLVILQKNIALLQTIPFFQSSTDLAIEVVQEE